MADTTTPTQTNGSFKLEPRDAIAKLVIYGSFGIIGLIILVYILLYTCANCGGDKFKDYQYIIGTLVPLLGTWVGAVIAFYFTKENFKAASDSMQNVIKTLSSDDKLKSLLAKDVMRKYSDIKQYPNLSDETLLKDIIAFMNSDAVNINRLPVFDANGIIKYCIHQSTFEKFISDYILSPPALPTDGTIPKAPEALTFKDFIEDKKIAENLKHSMAFVKPDANLLESKQQMDKLNNCLDVFVTEDGTISTKVLGWISNKTILDSSKV